MRGLGYSSTWALPAPPKKNVPAPLLRAEGIRFSYSEGGDFSLDMGKLELYPGEVLTLAGPNGCGKTTLAKILCGLYRPEQGEISFGSPARRMNAPELRTTVAYIFQNPDYQIFLPTLGEELAYGLKALGGDPEKIRAQVEEAIVKFRLPAADRSPALLSYGTRKRLQAASYWLLSRPVCLLDEADSGLSFRDFSEMIELFKSPDRALLIITHNADFARHYSCLLYTSPSPRDRTRSRMPSSA